jgi:hypothetical protein
LVVFRLFRGLFFGLLFCCASPFGILILNFLFPRLSAVIRGYPRFKLFNPFGLLLEARNSFMKEPHPSRFVFRFVLSFVSALGFATG